jgi:hypothetical protein
MDGNGFYVLIITQKKDQAAFGELTKKSHPARRLL